MDSTAGASGCLPDFPLFFSLTHVLFVALVSHRHSFSSSRSPAPPPSPLRPHRLPLSPRKEKIRSLTNKISAIPSEGELRQEPRIAWKKRQRAEGLSCLIWKAVFDVTVLRLSWEAACFFMAGFRLSPREEWPSCFRGGRKSPITPQRAGLVMPPLLPSPGGVENIF